MSQRLKGPDGVTLRPFAEKGVELLEWILLMYTKVGDTVLDMQAGTGAMGLACIKHNRKYYGVEADATVVHHANLRLGRAKKMCTLGLMN